MIQILWGILIILNLWGGSSDAAVSSDLLAFSAGRVMDHVVTSREVKINYVVESVLYGKKGRPPQWLGDASNEFSQALSNTLLEWAVALEAENFEAATAGSQQQATAIKKVKDAVKAAKPWKALQVTDAELESLVQRKLRSKQLIQFKVQAAAVPITDTEARRYFDENRLKFGNLPFEKFKSSIKSFLRRQQVDSRLDRKSVV